MSLLKGKGKYIAINFLLFAILYFSVSFNKEYIRPVYGNIPFFSVLTGSFPNFIAAYIISLFPLASVFSRKMEIKKGRRIIYSVAVLVFLILTIEEVRPFTGASKVYDIFDIIASGMGSLFAVLTFEFLNRKYQVKNH